MSTLRAWCFRIGGLFDKERKDRELAEELDSHIQMHVEDNLRAGMSPAEARRDALIKLGGVDQAKEKYRDRRGIPALESLLQDVRFGLRMLRKNPGFTVVAVLTLALGIGANTAIFSVINAVLLRPLPVRSPEQITVLAPRRKSTEMRVLQFSYPAFLDFRKQNAEFSDLFGYFIDVVGFSADGKADEIYTSDVTGNYFSALGVKPALGRLIAPEDDQAGIEPTVVLGYSFWQKRFGGDTGIIGKQVLLNGKQAAIIGVTAKGFRGVYWFLDMDAYLPLRGSLIAELPEQNLVTNRKAGVLWALGRLKTGVSLAQAQSSLDVIAARLAEQYPATDQGITVQVVPERLARPQPNNSNFAAIASGLFLGLSVLVLLLACVNITNLLLARAIVRQREMAIRAALGSGAGRIVRQIMTETMLLVLMGGISGMVLGAWASRGIGSMQTGAGVPFAQNFSFDWTVFAYALITTALAGVVAGLWPAIQASRTNLNVTLHEEGRGGSIGSTHHKIRGALVIAEIAGALVLLIIAGLFVRSLRAAEKTYLGFDPENILTLLLNPAEVGYDLPRAKGFYGNLEKEIRTFPQVISLASSYNVPMSNYGNSRSVYVEGQPIIPGKVAPVAVFNRIDESYLQTMRVPLLRGRGFKTSDDEKAQLVTLVNETMAERLWPGQDAIGKRFSMTGDGGPFMEVVGVIADGKYEFVGEPQEPYFCVPITQNENSRRALEIRTSGRPDSLIPLVQEVVHALDPAMPISGLESMNELLNGGNGLFVFRLGFIAASAMGIVGLTLAIVGIYGVISYSTSQRTREIGVRMSLGATTAQILKLIFSQGLVLIAVGVVIGLGLALAASRAVAHLLFSIQATDPVTYISAALVLVCVALLACYIPARRATKVDPMVALRHE